MHPVFPAYKMALGRDEYIYANVDDESGQNSTNSYRSDSRKPLAIS